MKAGLRRIVRCALACAIASLIAGGARGQTGTSSSPANAAVDLSTWASLRAIADSLSGPTLPVGGPSFRPLFKAGRLALTAYLRARLAGDGTRADSVLADCRLAADAGEHLYGSPFLRLCLGVLIRTSPDRARDWVRADSLLGVYQGRGSTPPAPFGADLTEARDLFSSVGDSLHQARCAAHLAFMGMGSGSAEEVTVPVRVRLIAERHGDLEMEAWSYLKSVSVLASSHGPPDSIAACIGRLIAVDGETKDVEVIAVDWDFLASKYMEWKRWAEAETAYRRAIDLASDPACVPSRARSYVLIHGFRKLSQSVGNQGRTDEALEYAQKSLEAARSENRANDVATSLSTVATAFSDLGRVDSAAVYHREAIELTKQIYGAEHKEVANRLYEFSMTLNDHGDFAAAEPLIRETLAMRKRLEGRDGSVEPGFVVSVSLTDLANLLRSQGDLAGAEPLYREADAKMRQARGEDEVQVATGLANLGRLLRDQGRYAEAESRMNEALAMRRRLLGEENQDVSWSLEDLATLRIARGDYAGAEPLARKALAMRRSLLGEESVDVAWGLGVVAQILYQRGDYGGAEPLLREALALHRKLLGEQHPDVASDLSFLAATVHMLGDVAGAETLLVEAVRVYEAARLRAGTGLARSTFQGSPYLDLAELQLGSGKTDQAWAAVENSLSRSLADLLFAAESRNLDPAETAREGSLKRALGSLEQQLAAYTNAARQDSAATLSTHVAETRNRLLAAEAEWSAFQQEVAARHPVTEGRGFQLERVQKSLSNTTAIVGWLDVEEGGRYSTWGYVLRNVGPVTWVRLDSLPNPASPANPVRTVREYRGALDAAETSLSVVRRQAHDLWVERFEPLAPALAGVKDLIVVTSGAMAGIPLESLLDDAGTWLGDEFAISYTPSATIFAWLQERARGRQSSQSSRALLVGDPPFNAAQRDSMEQLTVTKDLLASAESIPDSLLLRSALAGNDAALAALPRLPGTREEIRGIRSLSPDAVVLLGPSATEQELARLAASGEMRGFETIHLATHALIDRDRPERCALILSQVDLPDPLAAALEGRRIYDGVLTMKEILQEWRLDADVVTLSACETALGKEVGGEGTVGFAHAFLQAGARSLVESLWKVDDRATALLMERFYEDHWGKYTDTRQGLVGKSMAKAEALQEAKRWLREYTDEDGRTPYAHPYFWASFVLIGERD